MAECAWAAVKTKDTYFRSKYYALIPRMGKKKALMAIAHKIIIASYFILKDKTEFKELGSNYLQNKNRDQLVQHHLKRIEKLGYQITIEEAAEAA